MSEIISVEVKLKGLTPLIMHRPDPAIIRKEIDTKNMPAEEEASYGLYRNAEGKIVWPTQNLVRALYEAAKGKRIPGKGKMGLANYIPLIKFTVADIPLMDGDEKNEASPEVFEKQVRRGSTGGLVMAARPVFYDWSLRFVLQLLVEYFDLKETVVLDVVKDLFVVSGFRVGIGDWRPAMKGIYGTFAVEEFKKV